MKITETRIVERQVVKLFNDSRNQVNKEKCIEAQIIVKKILDVFELISVFAEFNHKEIVIKLYFCKNNIEVAGIRKISQQLYMDEKTLYKLRKKYCITIITILKSYKF